jgi:hypothetical protein
MNEKPKFDRPYTNCDRYDERLAIPYGEAGGVHEQLGLSLEYDHIVLNAEEDVHAEQNQECGGSKGQIPKDLRQETKYRQNIIPWAECILRTRSQIGERSGPGDRALSGRGREWDG